MVVIFLIIALSIPLLVWAQTTPMLLYVFAFTFGFGLGGDYMLIPLMTAECFGLAGLSRILGIIVMSDAVGEAATPWLIARIRENTGSYAQGFFILAVIALLGAVAIAAIKYRDGKPASRWQLEQGNV
jgi:sugar phosphate permease